MSRRLLSQSIKSQGRVDVDEEIYSGGEAVDKIETPTTYRYVAPIRRCLAWSFPLVSWGIHLVVISSLSRPASDDAPLVTLILSVISLYIPLVFEINTSSVQIDRNGLEWKKFEITWQKVRWVDVTKFVEKKFPEKPLVEPYNSYRIYGTRANNFAPIPPLLDTIEHFDLFRNSINHFIVLNHIPVVSLNGRERLSRNKI